MSANLNTISKILKEQYLPVLKNGISKEPSPFLEMIKKVPLTGGKITAIAPYGINGGFGFGSDGEATPQAVSRAYKRLEVEPVNMYVDIRISDKTVKLANDGGALINALDDEVAGSYEAAKWNVGRALFGDGSGVLCTCTSQSIYDQNTDQTAVVVENSAALVEGLVVDVYSYASSSSTEGILLNENKAKRIKEVDRNQNMVVFEGQVNALQNSEELNNYGFIVVQGSYNKEITGLKAIFDENITTLYGLEKKGNSFLKPQVVNAEGAITDQIIYNAVKKSYDYKNTKIDLVMMGNAAFEAYQKYMRENNVLVCDKATFTGGASGYKVMVGNRVVTVVNEKLVPDKEAWCVDTSAFAFVHLDFDFCDYGSSGIFQLVPGTSYYRALLASYGNLICKNPGGCVKITNCVE